MERLYFNLLPGLFCGFIGLDVRLTKEEPFKLNKEQNTDLKKGTDIHICLL